MPTAAWSDPRIIFSVLFHAGILIFALIKLTKKHILSFAILFYLVTISVFTNWFLFIPGIVAERLAFFPSLGFCIAFAWFIFFIFRADPLKEGLPMHSKTGILVMAILISIGYGIIDIKRNRDWKDDLTLFSRDIGYLRNSAKANELYASRLMQDALPKLLAGNALAGDSLIAFRAMDHLKLALSIDPTYIFAWNNLGILYFNLSGKSENAIESFRNAVNIDPSYAKAQYNLGHALSVSGKAGASVIHYKIAISSDPNFIPPRLELAGLLYAQGDLGSAIALNESVMRIDPNLDLPYINIGNYHLLQKDTIKAISYWEQGFVRNPTDIILCANLAGFYQHAGDMEKSSYYMKRLTELQNRRKSD
jgi:Tfp pilus assembly protein PilF